MRVFTRIAIFFYIFVISLVAVSFLLLLAHMTDLSRYEAFLRFVYSDPQAGTIAGVVVAATLLVSLVFARIIYGRQEKERTVSFDNPLGRVTISLSALEDLIRRLVSRTPQIKEIRPDIVSHKKGLEVDIRLTLHSGGNIPEITARLQDMIKQRIHSVIGKEERVNIRIHVMKIISDTAKSAKKDNEGEEDVLEAPSPVHFHGYRP